MAYLRWWTGDHTEPSWLARPRTDFKHMKNRQGEPGYRRLRHSHARLDGLELVAKTHASHPHIKFVLLSGFGEFEYANRAMQYGVKHYLLKPTDEVKIGGALKEVINELTQDRNKETFVQEMKNRLRKVLPHVKEQVLKEFVTNKTYGRHDLEEYRSLFEYDFDQPVRSLLFQLEGTVEYEHQFAVKNIAEDLLDTTR